MSTLRTIAISFVAAGLITIGLGEVYIARADTPPPTPYNPMCLIQQDHCTDIPQSTATTWQDLLLPPTLRGNS